MFLYRIARLFLRSKQFCLRYFGFAEDSSSLCVGALFCFQFSLQNIKVSIGRIRLFFCKTVDKMGLLEFYGLLFKSVIDNNDLFRISSYVLELVSKCPQRINSCEKVLIPPARCQMSVILLRPLWVKHLLPLMFLYCCKQ